ncbi:uncharacterized protein LOC111065350 isoform X1 [Drosophila obscura]|uniref:uncharacterized protein LOC111065350 isoform X1 n=1 Tax=Drosophila obscura TaxID=7282 RepID=UPI001BB29EE0|nr:uncharacterized protein LOC111065350 isoform X1 [Drosophila obscura]
MPQLCKICRSNSSRLICVPKDGKKRQLWITATQVQLKESHKICENHFNEGDFHYASDSMAKRRRLLPNAVPRREEYLYTEAIPSAVGASFCDFSSQTEKEVIECGIALDNVRLKLKIKELQMENDRLVRKLQSLEKLANSLKNIFTEKQISKLENGGTRICWSSEDISAGICLHAAGPRAYRHLLKKGFPLPCISTLHRWSQTVEINPGPLHFIFELMEAAVDRENEDKLCVLCFDEMKIRVACSATKPRNYVQVAMAQGLCKSWKQPIYYDFDKPMTMDTLHMLIKRLYTAQYHVVAMVSDMGSANSKLWTQLGISTEKTWFEHPANAEMKIYVFADVPQLVKQIRNHFLDTGLVVNGNIISAGTVKQAMNLASASDLSVSWKITDEHLNVNFTERQKIKFATQLLSSNTASAIRRCQQLGLQVDNASETADFITLANDWFDMFNVKLSTANSIATKQPFGKSLNEQRKLIGEMTAVMSALKVPSSKQKHPFQKGVIVSNTSLDQLFQYVGTQYGMEHLITNRISLQPLEHFFDALRPKAESNDHPNPMEFKYRLRKYLLSNGLGKIT